VRATAATSQAIGITKRPPVPTPIVARLATFNSAPARPAAERAAFVAQDL
jgi:hypothetical protein